MTKSNSYSNKKFAILVGVSMLLVANVTIITGQDLRFSQFMNNPLLTNPANTGFNPDFDYRIGGSFRNQWWGLPVPYKTTSIWGDVQINRDFIPNGWIGIGGMLLRDVAGSGGLTSTKGYGSIAYHQELGESSLLSAGFNLGYAVKRVDFNAFKWENQWNGKFFDANIGTGERFAYSQIGYLDVQAGINYAYFPNDNIYLNAGVSVLHVNSPKETFFIDTSNNNKVPVRTNVFLNAVVKLDDRWMVSPNLYYSRQSTASELVAGMLIHHNLSGDGEKQLLVGGYYRLGDAAIALIGLEWNSNRLTFSYDATLSNAGNYNQGNGAIEFSLIKYGVFGNRTPRSSRCPSFR